METITSLNEIKGYEAPANTGHFYRHLAKGREYSAGFEITSVENPLPVTPDTLVQVGSINKTFTGTMLMQLAEAGKVDLDAPVRRYIKDLKLRDEDVAKRVTTRHLLTHMGGWVGDYFNDFGNGDDALGGFPTPDSPPGPAAPPVRFAFYDKDKVIGKDEPLMGAYRITKSQALPHPDGKVQVERHIDLMHSSGPSKWRQGMDNLINFLDKLIGIREGRGNSHGQQVNVLASALARKLDFSTSDLANLEFAATIHDIGKITVNEFVINKAGRLTEAEFIMIQQHTALGYKLVEPLGLPKLVTDVILSHHENYDGSGYPHGLAGEEIPLAARIIRISDTYDALTSNRGYHSASSRKQALDIMANDARCFDPELLEIFMKMRIKKAPASSETASRHF